MGSYGFCVRCCFFLSEISFLLEFLLALNISIVNVFIPANMATIFARADGDRGVCFLIILLLLRAQFSLHFVHVVVCSHKCAALCLLHTLTNDERERECSSCSCKMLLLLLFLALMQSCKILLFHSHSPFYLFHLAHCMFCILIRMI